MKNDIIKGIFTGLGAILVTVAIGMGIGFACSGDYEGTVDPPAGLEAAQE